MVDVLPELDAVVVVHDGPDLTEAAVVDGAFDDDGDDAGEHEADLYHVGPHHGLHTALQTTHSETNFQIVLDHDIKDINCPARQNGIHRTQSTSMFQLHV